MTANEKSLTAESGELLKVLAPRCKTPGDYLTFDAIFAELQANGAVDMDRFRAGLRSLLELEFVIEYANALGLSDAGLRFAESVGVVQTGAACECGCGAAASATFLPGHDQRLRTRLESEVGGLLTLRDIVSLVGQYRSGAIDEGDLGRGIRRAFWTSKA